MSNNASMKNLDPRTHYVPEKYSALATDFMASTKQNKEYWSSIKTPLPPSNRIAFEELRQITVFVPLIPVAIVFLCIGKIAAVFAFCIALLVMRNLHLKVQRDIDRKWNEWFSRDQGRYAFTQFMCKEFGLLPQDVTLDLVERMCSHFILLMKARKRFEEENVDASKISSQGCRNIVPTLADEKQPASVHRSEGYNNSANQNAYSSFGEDMSLKINPATGLPMVDDCFDVHANTFGTSNMDDMWSSSNGSVFAASNDFFSGGSASFTDDSGL